MSNPEARELAIALGDARREGHDWRTNCPVDGHYSLTLTNARDGRLLVKCWGGCEWREIFAELRSRGLIAGFCDDLDLGRAENRRRREEEEAKAEIDRLRRGIAAARDLYRRARPAIGSPVERYLQSRGITGLIPSVLRYLQFCPHRNGRYYPAMVAPIVNVAGEHIAVHKTFLVPDDRRKADLPKNDQRETRGPWKSGAVRLARHRTEVPLVIGEGIESTISAMRLFGLPGWAAICARGIEVLELPGEIHSVAIAADNDASGTGQRKALAAYERWTAEGHSVRILLPPNTGEDFNDVLRSREAH